MKQNSDVDIIKDHLGFEWWERDKFYLEMSQDEQVEFLDYIGQIGNLGPSFIGSKRIGEIKNCPNCKERRITSCCACGCGSCFTRDYRWCCYGWSITNSFLDFKGSVKAFGGTLDDN